MSAKHSGVLSEWWAYPHQWDEGRRAIWEIEHPADVQKASCWQIQLYEATDPACDYLVLKAVRGNGNDGGDITLAISHTPRYDVYAQDVLQMAPAQSNPQRRYVFRSRWDQE